MSQSALQKGAPQMFQKLAFISFPSRRGTVVTAWLAKVDSLKGFGGRVAPGLAFLTLPF